MAADFARARELLAKALDAVMLPDDIDEGIADAFYELSLAFNGSDSSNISDSLVADAYEKLRAYEDTSDCTWVSRRHLEKAQMLSRAEKRDFCRCLLDLYTMLEARAQTDNAA